ncbi:MAG: DUF4382 domain-containing protein [Terracidiphilus sp.]
MDSRTQHRILPFALASLAAAALVATGCSAGGGSSPSSPTTPTVQSGSSFVVGTDAPMASVVSFAVQLQSVEAIDSNNNGHPLISGTPTVDFARFNGLQTLLDMNDVPVGTYNSVQITMGTATLGYLNVPGSGAPTIVTEAATLSTSTITVNLAKPLIITQAGAPSGLRMDFDLRKSIQVDSNGNITGDVTPTFNVTAVANTDPGGYIDCFDAAVVSVSSGGQSFVVQGPHGENFTVNVGGQTEWENNESISDLTTSSIVTISGTLDQADQTIDADDIGILTQTGFYAGGQITYVTPSSGPATSFDLYVRGLLPTTTGLTLGELATVDLSGNENYFIYWFHNPLTHFVFNQSLLLPGQHVSVGGPASGAANANDVTVKRVVLRHWGYNSTVVANSVNAGQGTFQIQINGFAGVLIPQTVTVYTAPGTKWRNGLSGITSVTSGANVRIVGLLIKDPVSGNTCLLAHYVDTLD